MKKYIISIAVILLFAAYIFYQRSHTTTQAAPQTVAVSTAPDNSTPATTSTNQTAPATGTPAAAGQYKDGSYTSPVTDAVYGKLQLQVVIANGAISDIQFLQQPDAPGHTTEVSQESLPQLKAEAIKSQSANVDIVSGATQTSQGFQQAMAAVLAQAKS